jgi:hypothetical protein
MRQASAADAWSLPGRRQHPWPCAVWHLAAVVEPGGLIKKNLESDPTSFLGHCAAYGWPEEGLSFELVFT